MLSEETAQSDPIARVRAWLDEAFAAGIPNAEAIALATCGTDARPSVRFVLCKHIDERGFVFYTNTESRKAAEIAANAEGALAFHWTALGRQARATGSLERVARAEAEAYYRTRPLGSRLGAWASPQSRPIASRAVLEQLWHDAASRFESGEPPLPPHWGGYRLVPRELELWEHRDSRLHDRLHYTRAADGWTRVRLAP